MILRVLNVVQSDFFRININIYNDSRCCCAMIMLS